MTFLNRLTGKSLPTLPTTPNVSLGNYLLTDASVRMNRLINEGGSYLLPDEHGQVRLEGLAGSWQGKSDCPLLNQPQLAESLKQISQKLKELEELELLESLEAFAEVSPLVSNMQGRLDLTEFEQQLVEELFHIEHIVRFPDSRLDRIEEKLPVSRVRRFSNRALNVLSAHSEDWLRRKYQSVIPRQVLAQRIDEDLDIFENRVTARLIRELITYLNRRIDQELKQLEEFFDLMQQILQRHEHRDKSNWYRKIHRNYELIGQAVFDDMEQSQQATKNTRETLQVVRQRLLILLGLPFFREVHTQAKLGRHLHLTNRFQSHPHYRIVAQLWQAWAHLQQEETASERQSRFAQTMEDFEQYSFLLLMRSLKLLNFTLTSEQASWEVGIWAVFHPALGRLQVIWERPYRRFRLENHSRAFYLLPWPDHVLPEPTEDLEEQLYLLYYYTSSHPPRLTIGCPDSLGYVPVSLFSPDSIERVARAILWELATAYWQSPTFQDSEACINCGKPFQHSHPPKLENATSKCGSCQIEFGLRKAIPFLRVLPLEKMLREKDAEEFVPDAAWLDFELGKDILVPPILKKGKVEFLKENL